MVKVSGQDQEEAKGEEGMICGILGGFFEKLKDTQVINAAENKM